MSRKFLMAFCTLFATAASASEPSIALTQAEFTLLQSSGVLSTEYPSMSLVLGDALVKKISPDQREDWQEQAVALIEEARACRRDASGSRSSLGNVPENLRGKILGSPDASPACSVLLTSMSGFCNFCETVRKLVEPTAANAGVRLRVLELAIPGLPTPPQ